MDELGPLYQRVESGSLIRRVRFTEVALAMPPPDPTPTLASCRIIDSIIYMCGKL